jgi:hypothetical protein
MLSLTAPSGARIAIVPPTACACASAITRGESACNFALFKRRDDQ